MVQIISENRRPSMGERLSQGVGRGLDMGSQMLQEHQQNQLRQQQMTQEDAAARRMGVDLSGMQDPKMRQQALQAALKGQQEQTKLQDQFKNAVELQKQKYDFESKLQSSKPKDRKVVEKLSGLESGMDALGRMREIRSKGNLGRGSALFGAFGGETAKDRGEYEQLGKSLISLSTNIPIRNRIEFETLAEKLYDPSVTDKEAEGVLNAMERILNNSLSSFEEEQDEAEEQRPSKELTQDVLEKIYLQTGKDEAETKKRLKKMGYKL